VFRRVLSPRATPITPASHLEPWRLFPLQVQRPSPRYGRVGTRNGSFGACSGFTARCGPRICWLPFRELLSGRLDDLQLPRDRPPVATRLNRPTASAGLPPARTRRLSRRTVTEAVQAQLHYCYSCNKCVSLSHLFIDTFTTSTTPSGRRRVPNMAFP